VSVLYAEGKARKQRGGERNRGEGGEALREWNPAEISNSEHEAETIYRDVTQEHVKHQLTISIEPARTRSKER
jgi:hypothetical protein